MTQPRIFSTPGVAAARPLGEEMADEAPRAAPTVEAKPAAAPDAEAPLPKPTAAPLSVAAAPRPSVPAAPKPPVPPTVSGRAPAAEGLDARTTPLVHAATRIGTPDGPRAVETLAVGDRVSTRGGAAAIREVLRLTIERAEWAYTPDVWPLRVPVGVLGNTCPMRVSPGLRVALPSQGDAILRLRDMVGLGGVARDRPLAAIRYLGLRLDDHALIDAEGGWVETVDDGPREVAPTLDRDAARATFSARAGHGLR